MLENQDPDIIGGPLPNRQWPIPQPVPKKRLTNREEVDQLLAQLDGPEANIVRMYHLEGKTYQEISRIAGMPDQ